MAYFLANLFNVVLLTAFIIAAGGWFWLFYQGKIKPWDNEKFSAGQKHSEIVMLICIAVGSLLVSLEPQESNIPELRVIATTKLEPFTFTVGTFESGFACNKDELSSIHDSIDAGIKRIIASGRVPEAQSLALLVGGHDREPLSSQSRYESNADLSYARANCVADLLKEQIKKTFGEAAVPTFVSSAGGAFSNPFWEHKSLATKSDSGPLHPVSNTSVLGRQNSEDRIVKVFLHLRKNEVNYHG